MTKHSQEQSTVKQSTVESPRFTRKQKIFAGLAGGALLAGVGVGAAIVSSNQEIIPQPTNSGEPSPSTTPDILPSETPQPETSQPPVSEMSQSEIDKYETMIQNGEFFKLPKQEQLTYWTQMASGTGDTIGYVGFTNDYALTSEQPNSSFVSPSLENTPYQVRNIAANAIRYALSLDIKSPDAEAAMYAVFYDNSPTSAGYYATFKKYLETFPGTMSGRVQGSKNVIASNSPIVDEANIKLQYDANKTPYMDITTDEPDGTRKTSRYYYIALPDSHAEGISGMWIPG